MVISIFRVCLIPVEQLTITLLTARILGLPGIALSNGGPACHSLPGRHNPSDKSLAIVTAFLAWQIVWVYKSC